MGAFRLGVILSRFVAIVFDHISQIFNFVSFSHNIILYLFDLYMILNSSSTKCPSDLGKTISLQSKLQNASVRFVNKRLLIKTRS